MFAPFVSNPTPIPNIEWSKQNIKGVANYFGSSLYVLTNAQLFREVYIYFSYNDFVPIPHNPLPAGRNLKLKILSNIF